MLLLSVVSLPGAGRVVFDLVQRQHPHTLHPSTPQTSSNDEDPAGFESLIDDFISLSRFPPDACVLAHNPFAPSGVLPRARNVLALRTKLKSVLQSKFGFSEVVFLLSADVHDAFRRVVADPELAAISLADMHDTAACHEKLFLRAVPAGTRVFVGELAVGAEACVETCRGVAGEVSAVLERLVAEGTISREFGGECAAAAQNIL